MEADRIPRRALIWTPKGKKNVATEDILTTSSLDTIPGPSGNKYKETKLLEKLLHIHH